VATARLAIALFAVMSLACAFTQNYEQLSSCVFSKASGSAARFRWPRPISAKFCAPSGVAAASSPIR
jgi:hypothetical protein